MITSILGFLVGIAIGFAIVEALKKLFTRKSAPMPTPTRVLALPRPVKVKIPNYTNAIAINTMVGTDIDKRLVTFYAVEHDQPFPFVKLGEDGAYHKIGSRTMSFMHGDWVEEL